MHICDPVVLYIMIMVIDRMLQDFSR